MSDRAVFPPTHGATSRSRRGQSLVEFALVLPLLLVLVLGAVDFGRVFFGWVALQNAARVGANYAATHPDAWAQGNTAQMDRYAELVEDSGARNCELTIEDPTFPGGTRLIGDPTSVHLTCDFDLITPLMGSIVGQPVTVAATSEFPIRGGCANCATSGSAPPPPPPANCRTIPPMTGKSVDGARLAWTAAGFQGVFTPPVGDGGRTVQSFLVDQHGEVGCNGTTNAFFSASVVATLAPITEPGPSDTCETVPNVLGMTVANARTTWTTAGFAATNFSPTSGADTQIVQTMALTPSAVAGDCAEPDLNVIVTYGAPPPPPPPPPCRVPSFVNTLRSAAQGTWTSAGFTGTVSFHPPANNWTVIQGQSLVGGGYAGCNSTITLMKNG
jgi:hypothetical protein